MSHPTWLQEFIDSAIDPALALANVEYLDGPQAVEAFLGDTIANRQKVQSYPTAENARLMRRYQHLEDGAWFATCTDSPYAKPNTPRLDEDGKPIKYETAPGMPASPLRPNLTVGTLRRICSTQGMGFDEVWGAITLADPTLPTVPTDDALTIHRDIFWAIWEALGGAVAPAEGLKKALALISHGIPAIALRGVYNWRASKGSLKLHPDLERLAKANCKIYITFDQDVKLKTVAAVGTQAERLGDAIEKAGGVARFPRWDGTLGKGIDDALAALPSAQRGPWLALVLQRSETLKEWRRRATKARARAILGIPEPKAQRHTEGEYLPTLPSLTRGAIHWIAANMGSGKTYRIGRDWVRSWIAAGGIVVVFSPLNSLGQQSSKDWGVPHLHDYGTGKLDRQALEADISVNGGIVACINSAHRVAQLIPKDRPLLLVIDEAAQTLTDAAQGGTLKGEWSARWEDVIGLMLRAANGGAIALAEDGLDQATITLVQELSGAALVRGFRHTREATPWPVTLNQATPLSEWRGRLLARLKAGDRILFVTTSRKEGRRLERAAKAAGISVQHRIDSETNEGGRYRDFFEAPEAWLYTHLPQLLILSPSGKTGLSIEGGITAAGAYFDSVWGYFPVLDTDTAMQLLGRYRPPVPRHIWAPAYIQPDRNEKPSPLGITHELETEAARYAQHGGFGQAPADPHDAAIKRYLALRGQRRWSQKVQAAESLTARLEAAGHQVEVLTGGNPNKAVQAQWDEIKEALAREDSAYQAGLELDETNTLDWAYQVQRSTDSTHEQRCKAAKVVMIHRFPGLDWDCPELWYQAQFNPNHKLAPGAALWAEADHWQSLWAMDTKEAAGILGQRLRAAHLLPQSGPRAMLAAQFKPLIEKLLRAGEVVPEGKTEAQVKALALKLALEIRRYWRLTITEDQSATEICNKIARKLGLDAGGVSNRLGKVSTATGRQQWVYRITASDTWQALVSAREWALRQASTDSLDPPINESVLSSPQTEGANRQTYPGSPPATTSPPAA